MKTLAITIIMAMAVMMTACSLDEIKAVKSSDSNNISFSPSVRNSSRVSPTTTDNISEFMVWGVTVGGDVVMEHETATKSGDEWTTTPEYDWPNSSVNFLAVTPATLSNDKVYIGDPSLDLGELEVASDMSSFTADFNIPYNAEDQVDFIYAIHPSASLANGSSVSLNFHHALSQILFNAVCADESISIEIAGVRVAHAYSKGSYTLPCWEDTSEESNVGEWDEFAEATYYKAALNLGSATGIELPSDNTVVSLSDASNPLYLIPQHVDAWDYESDHHNANGGAYFLVDCKILSNEREIWPDMSGVDYAEVAVPVEIDWKEGNSYTYTFVFQNGAGYYPPEDTTIEDPDGDREKPTDPESGNVSATPTLIPITLAVTVDDFEEATYDTPMLIDDILPDIVDPLFAEYLLETLDTDGDGHVSHAEAASVTSVECNTVEDFTGIGDLTNLKSFTSSSAVILDLSQNTALNYIYLRESPIEYIDLSNNTNLTKLTTYTFRDCENLTTVILPESITNMGTYTFYNCTSLEYVYLPSSLTTIGSHAFYNCSSLASIDIPDSVTTLDDYAFYKCTSLETIVLSENVTYIGRYAFNGCSSLTSIELTDNVTYIGAFAFYSSGLQSFTWPAGATIIYASTFYNCKSLMEIYLPEGITEIYNGAFGYCNILPTISLPSTVTAIGVEGGKTFSYTQRMTELYLYAETPPSLYDASTEFNYMASSSDVAGIETILHVPAGCVEAYKESEWAECGFDSIEEM